MATQGEIDAARQKIEQLIDQHGNDVRNLLKLIDSGAIKGKAANTLTRELEGFDAGLKNVFRRALALVDSAQPDKV
ncbi:hypothetical protein [Acrocarpospora catenulata]|uniref:hypothetical protein n=1 Tax=Acrocarpospora catenulata TaxID=2836182 RepID=UPI001BDAC51F|nr:hypothetical protein [Acrocarpospora catenulata]